MARIPQESPKNPPRIPQESLKNPYPHGSISGKLNRSMPIILPTPQPPAPTSSLRPTPDFIQPNGNAAPHCETVNLGPGFRLPPVISKRLDSAAVEIAAVTPTPSGDPLDAPAPWRPL